MAFSPALTDTIRQLLHESVRGEPGGTTWLSDGEGLLASARALSAAQASRAPTGDATVAGHVEHVRWFLAVLNGFARGETPRLAWNESWTVREVDDAAWRDLQAALAREFEELDGHLGAGVDPEDVQKLTPIVATVAHAAYHLGAVRQMLKAVR